MKEDQQTPAGAHLSVITVTWTGSQQELRGRGLEINQLVSHITLLTEWMKSAGLGYSDVM